MYSSFHVNDNEEFLSEALFLYVAVKLVQSNSYRISMIHSHLFDRNTNKNTVRYMYQDGYD